MVADVNLDYNIIDCEINEAKNKYMTSKVIKFKRKKHLNVKRDTSNENATLATSDEH